MGVLAFVPDVPSKQAKLSFVPRFPRRRTSTLGLSFLDCVSKVRRGNTGTQAHSQVVSSERRLHERP
jgi:hypothetical protein